MNEFFDVMTKTSFEQNGKIVTKWHKVGKVVITATGSRLLTMFNVPEVPYFIFEQKKKKVEEKGGE